MFHRNNGELNRRGGWSLAQAKDVLWRKVPSMRAEKEREDAICTVIKSEPLYSEPKDEVIEADKRPPLIQSHNHPHQGDRRKGGRDLYTGSQQHWRSRGKRKGKVCSPGCYPTQLLLPLFLSCDPMFLFALSRYYIWSGYCLSDLFPSWHQNYLLLL